MSNRAALFVSDMAWHCNTLSQNHEVNRRIIPQSDWLTSWLACCVKTLGSTAPLSVYTLMFSYFTASDIFMEENLFILGTKLDLIINKLGKNNKLIIKIPAEKVFWPSPVELSCFLFQVRGWLWLFLLLDGE